MGVGKGVGSNERCGSEYFGKWLQMGRNGFCLSKTGSSGHIQLLLVRSLSSSEVSSPKFYFKF